MIAISILAAVSSAATAYIMLCRINCKRWAKRDAEIYGYLFFLGASLLVFYKSAFNASAITAAEALMSIGTCIYFGQRAITTRHYLSRHNH